jgi:hypothetical protein
VQAFLLAASAGYDLPRLPSKAIYAIYGLRRLKINLLDLKTIRNSRPADLQLAVKR